MPHMNMHNYPFMQVTVKISGNIPKAKGRALVNSLHKVWCLFCAYENSLKEL